jgi:hypothetical protein
MTDELVKAIGRQIDHRKAKTDGESPYHAGNEWHADLWRIDNELIVGDYLGRYLSQWQVIARETAATHNPIRTHGGGHTTAGNSEGI